MRKRIIAGIILCSITLWGCSGYVGEVNVSDEYETASVIEYVSKEGDTIAEGLSTQSTVGGAGIETTEVHIDTSSLDYNNINVRIARWEKAIDNLGNYGRTAIGSSRYKMLVNTDGADQTCIIYSYDPVTASFKPIMEYVLNIWCFSHELVCMRDGEFAIFYMDNDNVKMAITRDGGANWDEQVVYDLHNLASEMDAEIFSISDARMLGDEFFIGFDVRCDEIRDYSYALHGTNETGYKLIRFELDEYSVKDHKVQFDYYYGYPVAYVVERDWRVNLTVKIYLDSFNKETINYHQMEALSDAQGTVIGLTYAEGQDTIECNIETGEIIWNDKRVAVDRQLYNGAISDGIDLDNDGFAERILQTRVGAHGNADEYILDIVDGELVVCERFPNVDHAVPLGKYTLYGSDIMEYVLDGHYPIYMDLYEDDEAREGVEYDYLYYNPRESVYDTVTSTPHVGENSSMKLVRDDDGSYILCYPMDVPMGSMAGYACKINAYFKYNDGNLDLIDVRYN